MILWKKYFSLANNNDRDGEWRMENRISGSLFTTQDAIHKDTHSPHTTQTPNSQLRSLVQDFVKGTFTQTFYFLTCNRNFHKQEVLSIKKKVNATPPKLVTYILLPSWSFLLSHYPFLFLSSFSEWKGKWRSMGQD